MATSMRFEEISWRDKDYNYDFIVDTNGKPVKATIKDGLIREPSSNKFMQNIEFEMVAETEKVP